MYFLKLLLFNNRKKNIYNVKNKIIMKLNKFT